MGDGAVGNAAVKHDIVSSFVWIYDILWMIAISRQPRNQFRLACKELMRIVKYADMEDGKKSPKKACGCGFGSCMPDGDGSFVFYGAIRIVCFFDSCGQGAREAFMG